MPLSSKDALTHARPHDIGDFHATPLHVPVLNAHSSSLPCSIQIQTQLFQLINQNWPQKDQPQSDTSVLNAARWLEKAMKWSDSPRWAMHTAGANLFSFLITRFVHCSYSHKRISFSVRVFVHMVCLFVCEVFTCFHLVLFCFLTSTVGIKSGFARRTNSCLHVWTKTSLHRNAIINYGILHSGDWIP